MSYALAIFRRIKGRPILYLMIPGTSVKRAGRKAHCRTIVRVCGNIFKPLLPGFPAFIKNPICWILGIRKRTAKTRDGYHSPQKGSLDLSVMLNPNY